ncbi:dephospho-CoA kinase [Bacteroidia bacterium]|nr:dephospho-CoA kinase [Bacteroidia bacterium]GHV44858.1 dephospho-CoA kinase [Bacteroidia bacterium]
MQMQKPAIIGITGGIGSGKSTVARYLCAQGYKVYDSDVAAKKIQNEDANVRAATIQLFGKEAYTANGMNRPFVAKCVFENKKLLQKLNEIVHPAVKADFLKWVKNNADEDIVFIESAILYESGFNTLVDKVLLISASKETRIWRVMRRDNATREMVIQRIENQTDAEELKQKADIVLYTDDDIPMNVKIFVLLKKLTQN